VRTILPRLDERYQKDPSMVSREVAGEMILVPIRQNVGDLESIYTLNETAARIWALIDGQRSMREIRDQIVEEFDVGEDEAQRDLIELLGQLEAIGAVERV
jgi:hypothetical protein